ncbi:MAG: hypothetical protein GC146_10760 [Limimaricola sp.]|uniref:hypothetical protein n=1 Tax=Limimaricola sp. TaxID=2211665 RepID=UPI001D42DB7D|nr:hypothetical protein [Limimaricola sp.]MBI1417691.1 hypothetical protein [Limimaricola sp.]
MRRAGPFVTLGALGLLAGCAPPPPPSPEQAAQECEARARAAQGPTGRVSIGVNNRGNSYVGGAVGITSDYLMGRDPLAVYNACVMNLTGQAPYRPPVLR